MAAVAGHHGVAQPVVADDALELLRWGDHKHVLHLLPFSRRLLVLLLAAALTPLLLRLGLPGRVQPRSSALNIAAAAAAAATVVVVMACQGGRVRVGRGAQHAQHEHACWAHGSAIIVIVLIVVFAALPPGVPRRLHDAITGSAASAARHQRQMGLHPDLIRRNKIQLFFFFSFDFLL